MTEPSVIKTVSYEVRGTKLDEVRFDDPHVEGLLGDAAALLQLLREARAKNPASAQMLVKSQVPQPPETTRDDCYFCSYTKVVNYITVETECDPIRDAKDFDLIEYYEDGSRGCGDCGIYIKSTSTVKNYKLIEDVIEGWEKIHRPVPQP